MIGRLLYHWFWNFYDYLGTYVLTGILFTLVLMGVLAAAPAIGLGGGVLLFTGLLFCFLVSVIMLSGLLPFASMGARGLPARFGDLWAGMKNHKLAVGKVLAVFFVANFVLFVGIRFYAAIGADSPVPALKTAGTVLAAALLWGMLFLFLFALPVFGGMFTPDTELSLRAVLRRGVLLFVLKPGVWITALVLFVLYLGVSYLTKIGFIFILPVTVSLITTAAFLVEQYAGFLADAKRELGDDQPLKRYKLRANELSLAWEAQQPKRTLKELIKPWEA